MDYLSEKSSPLEEEEIKRIFVDILKGLQFIRIFFKNDFIHEELKLDNIFLYKTSKGKIIAKIGEFFLAKKENMYEELKII